MKEEIYKNDTVSLPRVNETLILFIYYVTNCLKPGTPGGTCGLDNANIYVMRTIFKEINVPRI